MIGMLPDLIAKRAALSPRWTALEEIATGRCLDYAGLDRRASQVAAMLEARGVGEGDRVAIMCRNRIAFFELLFACAKLGAILVPLNWRMPPAEVGQLIAHCAPALLFHDGGDAAAVAQIPDGPPQSISTPAMSAWSMKRRLGPGGATGRPARPGTSSIRRAPPARPRR